MNKTEFADELSKKTNIPRAKALEITNAALDILSAAMVRKEKVKFIGFGAFETRYSPERKARNPRSGEAMILPAGYKPVFKAGTVLRKKLTEEK